MEDLAKNHSNPRGKILPRAASSKQYLVSSPETVRKPNVPKFKGPTPVSNVSIGTSPSRKGNEGPVSSHLSSIKPKRTLSRSTSSLTKPTSSSNASIFQRRNSTGVVPEKKAAVGTGRPHNVASVNGRKATPLVTDPIRRSNPELRRSLLLSETSKSVELSGRPELKKLSSVPCLLQKSESTKTKSAHKPAAKPTLSASTSKRGTSSPPNSSNGHIGARRVPSSISSPSSCSPTCKPGKPGTLSVSADKGSSLSSKRKPSTHDSRDSRFMMLPQVEIKAGDELRLDLRGHKIRSLSIAGLNLSPNLEFVYLRDNLLSSVDGIEILKRVKVLDLSFNDLKGPGFEPLENCKALQQLYLAGNKITSLSTLPLLPNLEFLSVAQNYLKSLCMASQPRLQVLAASKNMISTLNDFPHMPLLEHLRMEENPILEMPHIEAASILLVGPTLKKFNDRDLSPEELEIAKLYPAHTALCIRDGWEFGHPEFAAESTFHFLNEKWKENLPPGYMLKEASVDDPFEDDACNCHFKFTTNLTRDLNLVLKYQWFVGERTPTNFFAIADAADEVYWPKHEDIGKFLKVECTPILEEIEYPSIFAISPPVSPGTGYPKVLNLCVNGELVEGSVIRGNVEIAWCGGTPGKGVASWLRRRWNSSPVVILGSEDVEYRLTVDDIDSSLVFMYTPVTEEGSRGEPQYAMTDFVKAAPPSVKNVSCIGDAVEGNTIKAVGEYFGGREGPSKFEWLRENKESGSFVSVLSGTTEYILTKEDVGRRLAFIYIPVNFEGQEGESMSIMTEIVKRAPPKVSNLKIIGELREGSKVSVSAVVTGGSESSSRVQWFKTNSSKVEGEFELEAVSASKIAKIFRIPLGAVGFYLVGKFTPVAPDGETGEPAYIVSEKVVETLPPSLNFLTVTGEYLEGEILTASYGYIGGHEGKSLYNWYLHETETDPGEVITEASGYLQYRVTKLAIGSFISFKCTPIRDDGIVGEARTVLGQERVRPGSPRLLSLCILGNATEGSTLFADKKYWGGEEGESIFHWFLTSPDGSRKEIEGSNTSSYNLVFNDIGFMVSASCEPVRNDSAHGPVMVSEDIGPVRPGLPTCQSIEFVGSMIEGNRLSFISAYQGGEKGRCTHEWYRVKGSGTKEKLSADDYLDLSIEDVGRSIELLYTPMRRDGVKGAPKSIVSDVIVPANPRGVRLLLPDCHEDKEVIPLKSYFGGEEGTGDYIWFRTKRKFEESELVDISLLFDEVVLLGNTLTYTPSIEDIDSYLILYWVPTRIDGKKGDQLVAISNLPVIAAFPVVSSVCIKKLDSNAYAGEGLYYGGCEGSSLYSWYRETHEGTNVLINGANARTYVVTDFDYNCRLRFGYTPVRSDSTIGELKLSDSSDVLFPELPEIEMLAFKGREMEGEVLTAVEVIPNCEIQCLVWRKYKKDVEYRWFSSTGIGDCQSFKPLPSQVSSSYRVCLEDIGYCLKCECTVTDVFGRSSAPISAVTAPILPGVPKINKLEIEGRGYHTNLYAVHGIYSGGKEGKSRIQWLRSMVGSPDLISIPGEVDRMYEANVDDVGYRLVVVYTPEREDGVVGQPISASTEPIAVEPDIYREVKQNLDLGAVKFEALYDKDRSLKKVASVGNLEKRILEVNRKRIKVVKPGSKTSFPSTEIRGTYAPPFHIELYRNDQHRFKIVVDSENEAELMVQTRHMRDIIVLVIRGFAQRFNSTSLNSLLKVET